MRPGHGAKVPRRAQEGGKVQGGRTRGDALGGHRVLKRWMEVKRQWGALSANELQGDRGVTLRLET